MIQKHSVGDTVTAKELLGDDAGRVRWTTATITHLTDRLVTVRINDRDLDEIDVRYANPWKDQQSPSVGRIN